jgi:hypothetical protein
MSERGIGYEDYRPYLEAFQDALLARLGEDLIALVLYGSVARGRAKRESDIDLLVIVKNAPSDNHSESSKQEIRQKVKTCFVKVH